MTSHVSKDAAKLDQGRNLARKLYDLKLGQLERIDENQRKDYLADYPLLGAIEFNDVRRQVIEAKRMHQARVGWLSIPHDITVLVFVMVTWLTDWRWAALAAAVTLVVFESLFQVYFSPQTYSGFSLLVWLTYPAYVLLAYVLYTRGLEWYWIALAVVGIWGGTYLAGIIARIPMQLYVKSRVSAAKRKAGLPAEEKKI